MGRQRAQSTRGFTLVELMVVVGILAILASIAVTSFAKYSRRAKVSEAYTMLGMIRMRQETYRSEFSQYCDVSSTTQDGTSGQLDPSRRWPSSAPGRTPADWFSGLPAEWTQLGVRPTGAVYFRYATVAGNPGVVPSVGGENLGYPSAPSQDAWWVAQAYGDLDGDTTESTFEAFSLSNGIWVKDGADDE